MRAILPGVVNEIPRVSAGMTQVQVFADVHRSAESMWRELGSFQGITRWHPMVTSAEGEGEDPGATRTLTTRDGLRWVARLTERDASHRFYRYDATSCELPIADFRGELRIREGRPHRCTVIWTALFTVTSGDDKSISDNVRQFFRAGARAIEKQYAAPPVTALRRRARTLTRRR